MNTADKGMTSVSVRNDDGTETVTWFHNGEKSFFVIVGPEGQTLKYRTFD